MGKQNRTGWRTGPEPVPLTTYIPQSRGELAPRLVLYDQGRYFCKAAFKNFILRGFHYMSICDVLLSYYEQLGKSEFYEVMIWHDVRYLISVFKISTLH